jgi:hypothetical protein
MKEVLNSFLASSKSLEKFFFLYFLQFPNKAEGRQVRLRLFPIVYGATNRAKTFPKKAHLQTI